METGRKPSMLSVYVFILLGVELQWYLTGESPTTGDTMLKYDEDNDTLNTYLIYNPPQFIGMHNIKWIQHVPSYLVYRAFVLDHLPLHIALAECTNYLSTQNFEFGVRTVFIKHVTENTVGYTCKQNDCLEILRTRAAYKGVDIDDVLKLVAEVLMALNDIEVSGDEASEFISNFINTITAADTADKVDTDTTMTNVIETEVQPSSNGETNGAETYYTPNDEVIQSEIPNTEVSPDITTNN